MRTHLHVDGDFAQLVLHVQDVRGLSLHIHCGQCLVVDL